MRFAIALLLALSSPALCNFDYQAMTDVAGKYEGMARFKEEKMATKLAVAQAAKQQDPEKAYRAGMDVLRFSLELLEVDIESNERPGAKEVDILDLSCRLYVCAKTQRPIKAKGLVAKLPRTIEEDRSIDWDKAEPVEKILRAVYSINQLTLPSQLERWAMLAAAWLPHSPETARVYLEAILQDLPQLSTVADWDAVIYLGRLASRIDADLAGKFFAEAEKIPGETDDLRNQDLLANRILALCDSACSWEYDIQRVYQGAAFTRLPVTADATTRTKLQELLPDIMRAAQLGQQSATLGVSVLARAGLAEDALAVYDALVKQAAARTFNANDVLIATAGYAFGGEMSDQAVSRFLDGWNGEDARSDVPISVLVTALAVADTVSKPIISGPTEARLIQATELGLEPDKQQFIEEPLASILSPAEAERLYAQLDAGYEEMDLGSKLSAWLPAITYNAAINPTRALKLLDALSREYRQLDEDNQLECSRLFDVQFVSYYNSCSAM